MLNQKTFLAVDFGAGSLKLAEFAVDEAGGLVLQQFAIRSLGPDGSQETKREAVILKALQEVIAERGIKSRDVNVCAPGFHVFSKFVKLPPVDAGKVTQIIQYEAQQNVPFPLTEVVWDYQILGSTPNGELEVLLVAIKSDIVEGLFRVTEAAGLRLQLCDVSPAALCNAFRYNYGELDDCTMLLDIGAKTSNLLFFEKGKVFSRSINLGANSITQDFANESKKKFEDAEKIKVDEGFVSLGGAYEEPENPNQAAISKIARQFMTRLHIQVNQTMQFYRGQQGGGAPQRLYLSGGASIMTYTAQFFAEKLNVPVEYFNPFRSVQIDPGVNLEELAKVAHSLGEVVGLGLRNLAHCPVELNLMPDSTLRWQSFNQKKPYFLATVFSLVGMAFAVGFLFKKQAAVYEEEVIKLERQIQPLQSTVNKFTKHQGDLKKALTDLDQVGTWMEERRHWAKTVLELRDALIRAESATKQRLGTDTGVWIESLSTMAVGAVDPNNPPINSSQPEKGRFADPRYADPRYQQGPGRSPAENLNREVPPPPPPPGGEPGAVPPPPPAMNPDGTPAAPGAPGMAAGGTNEMATLVCRAINLKHMAADADTTIAYAVEKALKDSPMFEGAATSLSGQQFTTDDATGTFTFTVNLAFKRPHKP